MLKPLPYPSAIAGRENNSHGFLRRWFVLALLLCLVALIGGCARSSSQLRVGVHSVDVSPLKLPAIRNGGFIQRTEDRVVDPLYARCFVIDSGQEAIAIAVVDSCIIPSDVCERAKELAHQQTGIAFDRILISSTHTHNAPSVMNMCLGSNSDPDYEAFLPPKIA